LVGLRLIVSRGELIEIGTTNRKHLKDYAEAIRARTGLVLKVHTSNYRIEGFTKQVGARELAELTRERNVRLVNDLAPARWLICRAGDWRTNRPSPRRLPRRQTLSRATSSWADRRRVSLSAGEV
jgi:seryl-tRNA(Sec) selenium transferase